MGSKTKNTESRGSSHIKQQQQVSSDVCQEAPKCKPKIIKITKKVQVIRKKGNETKIAVDPFESESSSVDEMPLSKRMLLPRKVSAKKRCSSNVIVGTNMTNLKQPMLSTVNQRNIAKKICNNNVAVGKNITNLKQPMPITVNQRKIIQTKTNSGQSPPNPQRSLKNEEELCREMLDRRDKHVLFGLLVKEMEAEQILKGYKAKRHTWGKQQIQEEAARVLDINLDSESATDMARKRSSVQKVLQELPNFVDSKDEFTEMVLKAYGHQLNAAKVFELLDDEEVKKVIAEKYSAEELMGLCRQSDNRTLICQILEMASVDAIAHEIKTRNNLETAQVLLKVLLEMFSEMPGEMNSSCSTSNVEAGLTHTIIDVINSKKYLKTSESILSLMLQNVKEMMHSKEIMEDIMNVLINEVDTVKLVDLLHVTIKRSLDKNKNISLIDISDL